MSKLFYVLVDVVPDGLTSAVEVDSAYGLLHSLGNLLKVHLDTNTLILASAYSLT